MTLIEACSPVFVYAASLKRAAARGLDLDGANVRQNVLNALKEARETTAGDTTLARQFKRVELPLIFFLDFMILEGGFSFADNWKPIAFEHNELAGDQKFFEMLEDELARDDREALDVLDVYSTCIGLGFAGMYDPRGEEIARYRRRLASRFSEAADDDGGLTPKAYDHTEDSAAVVVTGEKVGAMIVALVGLALVLVLVNWLLFRSTSQEVSSSLDNIMHHASPPARMGDQP